MVWLINLNSMFVCFCLYGLKKICFNFHGNLTNGLGEVRKSFFWGKFSEPIVLSQEIRGKLNFVSFVSMGFQEWKTKKKNTNDYNRYNRWQLRCSAPNKNTNRYNRCLRTFSTWSLINEINKQEN